MHCYCEKNTSVIDTTDVIYSYILKNYDSRTEHSANARLMRNLFESSLAFQANRIVELEFITDKDLSTITQSDILQAIEIQ